MQPYNACLVDTTEPVRSNTSIRPDRWPVVVGNLCSCRNQTTHVWHLNERNIKLHIINHQTLRHKTLEEPLVSRVGFGSLVGFNFRCWTLARRGRPVDLALHLTAFWMKASRMSSRIAILRCLSLLALTLDTWKNEPPESQVSFAAGYAMP